jgi:hypothetical protein
MRAVLQFLRAWVELRAEVSSHRLPAKPYPGQSMPQLPYDFRDHRVDIIRKRVEHLGTYEEDHHVYSGRYNVH